MQEQEILLNIESKEIRYAALKFGQLQDLVIERKKTRQITGNIYRGKVINILHNIQSAFININESENGFIHISDIVENIKKFEELYDMDFEFDKSHSKKSFENAKDIKELLKLDQPVLVQVVKEPIGTKGARLTSNISIAGRYLVLLPNTPHRGVSRKVEDKGARERLKKIIRSFEMPQDMGLICRTASVNATTEMLVNEANDLLKNWQGVVEKFNSATGPTCLYEESDLIKRAVLTAVDKQYDKLYIDDFPTFERCLQLYKKYEEEHSVSIEFYKEGVPLFEKFNVEKEIDKALRRKVWLNCGGYLFFDRTEAMWTIDVNSGRSTQTTSGGDVEETLVRINLEAAEEIARQLRLRNMGGLIICDFIDMRIRKNQKRVLEKLKECTKEDFAKCTVLGMSEFGLIEMTRQRSRESLIQTLFTCCPYCAGNALIKSHESVSIEIERCLKKLLNYKNAKALKLVVHPDLDNYLNEGDKEYFKKLAAQENASLEFKGKDTLHLNEFQFFSTHDGKRIDI